MRHIRAVLAILAAMLLAPAATAAWMEAGSDHFLIYADADEAWLREFATRLERFDRSLRVTRGIGDDPGRRANRLTIYVVEGLEDVRRLCGGGRNCAAVAGFYVPRLGGSVAYTPRRSGPASKWNLGATTVLLHEYAHHFMFQNFAAAYPAWFSEGFAEFNATARFDEDGGITFGAPALHRAYGLMTGRTPLPMERLLGLAGERLTADEREAIYGRGWLLTHYLLNDDGRREALERYLRALNAGTPPLDAGRQAFGDLRALDRTLETYKRGRFGGWTVRASALRIGPVAIRALGVGEAAAMKVRMRSDRGVDDATAQLIVREARRMAAPFPADAAAQLALAEAEYDAGNGDAALAAAERAITADPRSVRAHLYKGRVLVDRAAKAGNGDAGTWREARSWYLKANRIEPNGAEPLTLFYRSFLEAGQEPTANAAQGLLRAFVLAPEDHGLRWMVARHYLTKEDGQTARRVLTPLAYDPHSAGLANRAAAVVALIDAGNGGQAAIAALEGADKAEKGDDAAAEPTP